jgi:hypothetical protein
MFLGYGDKSCEDNILTLVHDLFTAQFLANFQLYFGFGQKKRLVSEALMGAARAYTS